MTPVRQIIACAPTDANAQLASWGSTDRYSPGIDYTLTRCESCGTDMWLGPTQKAAYEAVPSRFVRLCMTCAIKAAPDAVAVRMVDVDSPRRIS